MAVKKYTMAKKKTHRPPELSAFLRTIAVGAGQILLKHFRKKLQIKKKPGAGIVTQADTASETYLLKQIKKQFPNSEIVTEETGVHRKEGSEYRWIMDPLDGTSNFAHGFPWFCVSIGVEKNGELIAGVIYHPCLNEVFWAVKGKGAFVEDSKGKNRKRLHVSGTKLIEDAMLGTGFYYFTGMELSQEVERFGRMSQKARAVRRPGAAALDMAYVACGRFDGFWERGLSAWDVAAGFVLISEAGGRVSDYAGKTATVDGAEVLASNGLMHDTLSQILLS